MSDDLVPLPPITRPGGIAALWSVLSVLAIAVAVVGAVLMAR